MSQKLRVQLIRETLKQVSVEPFVFLVSLAYDVRHITMQSLFHDRACRVSLSFSDAICDNLDSGDYEAEQSEAVKYGNNLFNVLFMVATLPAIVIATFLGPWSDRYGRKFPMILACSGILIDTTIESIITTIPGTSPIWYIACASISGFSGGLMVIMSTSYSYMSDITNERSRQTRFAVLEFFTVMATPCGAFIGGKVFSAAGYLPVMLIGNCSAGFAMLWLCFYMKETVPSNADITKKQMLQDVFKLDNIKESYKTCMKPRPGNLRLQLFLLVLVSFTLRLIYMGSIGIGFSYTRTVFKWGVERFSNTTTMFSLLKGFAVIVIVPYLNRKLLVHEAAVGLIGVLSLMTEMILLSSSAYEWILFYAWFSGCLFACGGIAVRSRVSKLVSRSELGKVFSLFGICESPTPVLGSLMMIQLHNLSVDFFPGLPYALAALLLIPSAVIFMWMMNFPSMTIEQYTESEDAKNMKELEDVDESVKTENVNKLTDATVNVF